MEHDVRSDAELLELLVNEAPIVPDRVTGRNVVLSAKQVATWTGRSIHTVSDYKNGKSNIPADFWRQLLEHYFDLRIL